MPVLAPDRLDLVRFSFPIDKSRMRDTAEVNPVDGTPDLEIAGKCTDGTLDSDLQIVDPAASLRWIKSWSDSKGNIRFQHDPRRPVGKGYQVDGHVVRATIADPLAKHLIRTGVLSDFSVGIVNPDVRKGDPRFRHLDPMGKAVNGVITDRGDGSTGLAEISICDRGANYGASFSMVKAAADGTPEWTGKMDARPELIEKLGAGHLLAKGGRAPKAYKTVSVDFPADAKLRVSPALLAKMNTMAQRTALKTAAPSAAKADVVTDEPGRTAVGLKADALEVVADAEDAALALLGKASRTFTAGQRREHASEGTALPDGSYPMPDADAVRPGGDPDPVEARQLEGRGETARPPGEGPRHPEPAEEEAGGVQVGQDCWLRRLQGRGHVRRQAVHVLRERRARVGEAAGRRRDRARDHGGREEAQGHVRGLRRQAERQAQLLLRMLP